MLLVNLRRSCCGPSHLHGRFAPWITRTYPKTSKFKKAALGFRNLTIKMADTSPLLTGPLGNCCIQSVKHTGTPVGKTIKLADVETYLSEPQAQDGQKKVILYLADVYGPFYLNSKLLQDYYASHGSLSSINCIPNSSLSTGYIVLGIDYFLGDPIHNHLTDPTFDKQAWFGKSVTQAVEIFPRWLKAVREKYGADTQYTAIGGFWFIVPYFSCWIFPLGYCFGAPFAAELAATDDVVAGQSSFCNFTVRRSFTLAFVQPGLPTLVGLPRITSKSWQVRLIYHRHSYANNLHGIPEPFLLLCAGVLVEFRLDKFCFSTNSSETDSAFPTESRRRAEDILIEKKATYHIRLFSGVEHGFATKGDPTIENTRKLIIYCHATYPDICLRQSGWAKEQAAHSVIEWFNRFTK